MGVDTLMLLSIVTPCPPTEEDLAWGSAAGSMALMRPSAAVTCPGGQSREVEIAIQRGLHGCRGGEDASAEFDPPQFALKIAACSPSAEPLVQAWRSLVRAGRKWISVHALSKAPRYSLP
jgi:hypothetical protein